MKKFILFLMVILSTNCYADSKISEMTADTSPTLDDLTVTVNDPGGTPANRKVTLANLKTLINTAAINWGSIGGTITAQNWVSPIPYLPGASVNWTDVVGLIKPANSFASGQVPIANLATGTPTGSKFIRDDGTLQTPTSSQWTTTGSKIYYSTGNVGIGSGDPQQALVVVGDTYHNGKINVGDDSTSALNTDILIKRNSNGIVGQRIKNLNALGTAESYMFLDSDTVDGGFEAFSSTFTGLGPTQAGRLFLTLATGSGLSLATANATPISFYTNGVSTEATNRLTITSSGNIGVGTAVPLSFLDINRKFNVFSGGNVGVGSTTPGTILDVQGTIRALGYQFAGNVGISTTVPCLGNMRVEKGIITLCN